MLSCPLLSSLLLPPGPKSLVLAQPMAYPFQKNPILTRGLESRKKLGGRFGVSDQKNMAELVRLDPLRGTDDNAEEEGEEAVASTLSNGTVAIQGFETTLNRMSKWLMAALLAAFILWRHDAEALWAAMGSFMNSTLSVILKQLLNHERPVSALRSDPGMPSSHAQSIFFLAFYINLSMFNWAGMNMFTITAGAITYISCSYLSWLRVSQQFHTISQVLVGAAFGSTCGVAWFWMWHSLVETAFIASMWVRITVILGSVAFCLVLYVIQS